MEMPYRRMGRTGLQVSVLSFGSWVTFGSQLDTGLARDCLAAAREHGVNFYDNAEVYAGGESERIMGAAIAELGWPRWSYVLTTKVFWGIHDGPNMKNTPNRKYLMQAIDPCLDRLQTDFVDVLYCHRPDPDTPIEETVWAMSDIVASGRALYWGTSEWSADEIRAAIEIADRRNLHAPVVEQPQYNLLERKRVEREYARLYEDHGIGLSTWSPLASGLLTGKYLEGVPEGSRASLKGYGWLKDRLVDDKANQKVRNLVPIAEELECSLAQLAVAWCAANPHVSTVITGASRVEQVHENMAALAVLPKLTPEVLDRIAAAVK
jgi:voltage-dependent potassium channel beta subunit